MKDDFARTYEPSHIFLALTFEIVGNYLNLLGVFVGDCSSDFLLKQAWVYTMCITHTYILNYLSYTLKAVLFAILCSFFFQARASSVQKNCSVVFSRFKRIFKCMLSLPPFVSTRRLRMAALLLLWFHQVDHFGCELWFVCHHKQSDDQMMPMIPILSFIGTKERRQDVF